MISVQKPTENELTGGQRNKWSCAARPAWTGAPSPPSRPFTSSDDALHSLSPQDQGATHFNSHNQGHAPSCKAAGARICAARSDGDCPVWPPSQCLPPPSLTSRMLPGKRSQTIEIRLETKLPENFLRLARQFIRQSRCRPAGTGPSIPLTAQPAAQRRRLCGALYSLSL